MHDVTWVCVGGRGEGIFQSGDSLCVIVRGSFSG